MGVPRAWGVVAAGFDVPSQEIKTNSLEADA